MRQDVQKWHNDVLACFQSIMYETLIHRHNIISDTVKAITFEDEQALETEPVRGYLAVKEFNGKRSKYFIPEHLYDSLPIRVKEYDEYYLKDSATKKSIILNPIDPPEFKITPEQTFDSVKTFIDELAPFQHSNPDAWTMMKFIAIMGYIGKTFMGICSPAELGKSSIFEILDGLTKKNPVFQPRSVPGVLMQITGDGNMIFDEVHKSNKETRMCMENFTLQVAGNKPIYINGALKTNLTKSKYDVALQSITYLYNIYSYYSKPEEEFFDYFFSNNGAMDSRILKVKFDGKLTEKFTRDFDMMEIANENKMYYMKINKYLLWLKLLKQSNKYVRKYTDHESNMKLEGRHKLIYDEITWIIDMYSTTLDDYKRWIKVLNDGIRDYKSMINFGLTGSDNSESLNEDVFEWDDNCKVWQLCVECQDTPCNIGSDTKPYCKKHLR